MLRFNELGYLDPGDYPMTFNDIRNSVLILGDETCVGWNPLWRLQLLDNFEKLVQPLWVMGIDEIYIDGSFCSSKGEPGDIDAYFNIDFKVETAEEAYAQLKILTHELNSLSEYPVWDWWNQRLNHEGDLKCEMWFKYRVEIFPNCFGVYAGKNDWGQLTKFEEMFRYDDCGIEKGVVRLLKG